MDNMSVLIFLNEETHLIATEIQNKSRKRFVLELTRRWTPMRDRGMHTGSVKIYRAHLGL